MYLNPFRDPLSYLFLLASVGVFVQSLKTRRMWGVAAAGLLLGLACSVREPSVLMLLPLFAYGWLAWRNGRPEPGLWRPIGAFALGMAVGVAPLLVQSYLATHQVLVPHNLLLNVPETQEESRIVPGMYFTGSRLAHVAGKACSYYLGTEKLLLLLAAVGVVAAVRRRNRLVLSLVLPTAVGYAVFYAFYRMFVPRYFYVAVLFFSLLAGYGLQALMRLACEKIRPLRRGPTAGWLLLAAVALATSVRLLGERAEVQPHQVPQARAMAAAIRETCPDAAALYASRPFSEWIEWFLQCESGPLGNLVPDGTSITDPGGAQALRDALAPRWARGDNLYVACWQKNADTEADWPFIRRAIDGLPIGSFAPRKYGAEGYANGTVWFYRLAPWTNLCTKLDWPVPELGNQGGAYWFMLDVGDWPEGHAPATLAVEGTLGDFPPMPHGGTWVGGAEAKTADAGRTLSAAIASPDPLPRAMVVRTERLDEPLVLDFRACGTFDHFWRWTGDIRYPSHPRLHPGVGILSEADLELPVPHPARTGALVELEIIADGEAPGVSVPVCISEDGRLLARTDVSGDRTPTRLVIPLPHAPDREIRRLHFAVEPREASETASEPAPMGIECLQATIHRWPTQFPVTIGIGTPGDFLHTPSGFSRREGRGNAAYRWTTGPAETTVFLPATDRPLALDISGSVGGKPLEARCDAVPALRIAWDGVELPGRLEWAANGNDFVWKGELPAGAADGRTPHRLGFESPAWRPADYGSQDSRTLGVCIGRIVIAPIE